MDVVVVGGHGQVALHLERILATANHRVRAIIRNPDHEGDVRATGAEPVVHDLESPEGDLAEAIEGADAVVFAAGAGPGSGPARKKTVDLGGALQLIDACRRAGVRRYVIVSSIGAHDPSSGPEQMRPYLEAKAEADRRLADSGLDWTIVRPGMLTDDPGTGRVKLTPDSGTRGPIPREDVARVLAAVLGNDNTIGTTFVAVSGDDDVDAAVQRL